MCLIREEPRQNIPFPLLSEQNLVLLGAGMMALALVVVLLVAFLVRNNPALLPEFTSFNTLYMVTVATVLFLTGTLALEGNPQRRGGRHHLGRHRRLCSGLTERQNAREVMRSGPLHSSG